MSIAMSVNRSFRLLCTLSPGGVFQQIYVHESPVEVDVPQVGPPNKHAIHTNLQSELVESGQATQSRRQSATLSTPIRVHTSQGYCSKSSSERDTANRRTFRYWSTECNSPRMMRSLRSSTRTSCASNHAQFQNPSTSNTFPCRDRNSEGNNCR